MIRSAMSDIKKPPLFICDKCGFEGLFTPEKCPSCGDIVNNHILLSCDKCGMKMSTNTKTGIISGSPCFYNCGGKYIELS